MRTSKQLGLPLMPLEKVQAPARSLRQFIAGIRTALKRSGRSEKELACLARISPQQFSNQLAYDAEDHREHLSLWRMHDWPPEVWQGIVAFLIAYFELAFEVRDPDRDVLTEVARAFLKGQRR